jgi:drug/metabolite transporter (DMT)-like permease
MTQKQRATAAGFAAVLLWSALALLATSTGGIPPFELLALSFGVAGIAGFAWVLRPGGEGVEGLRQPAGAAALSIGALFGYHALYFIALKRAPAVEASLINYLWPLLIVVLAAPLAGARVLPAQWFGAALGLVAAALLVTRGGRVDVAAEHVPGYAAAFGAAWVWATYSVLNRRNAGVPSTALTVACAATAALGALVHALAERWVAPTTGQWLAIVAIGLGPTGFAFLLWDRGTKHGDLAVLGTLAYAAPVLSTAWLLAFGRAQPHWSQAVAVALLLLGAWLSVRGARSD